jgi:hypothetical protein
VSSYQGSLRLELGGMVTPRSSPGLRSGHGGARFQLSRGIWLRARSYSCGYRASAAAGSDDVFHALWTDSNNKQTVVWFYGTEFVPTLINQEDIATVSGSY